MTIPKNLLLFVLRGRGEGVEEEIKILSLHEIQIQKKMQVQTLKDLRFKHMNSLSLRFNYHNAYVADKTVKIKIIKLR